MWYAVFRTSTGNTWTLIDTPKEVLAFTQRYQGFLVAIYTTRGGYDQRTE